MQLLLEVEQIQAGGTFFKGASSGPVSSEVSSTSYIDETDTG